MSNPTSLIFFGVVILLLIAFMFRNSRKRQKDQATLTQSLRPGAEIMTSGGIFGTIEQVDEDENKIVLKTGPTSHITIHRQAVGRVVTPAPEDAATTPEAPTLNGEPLEDPAYGERVEPVEETDGASSARGSKRDSA